ncbi:hypothetical protein [Sinorhizobium medicae]|uniref:hypothetical protein n=1 Tax=Sinorhizobium medicae TaxID=110321 RepID=UPI0018659E91|nr:hypothetical protein [Sinorhizobium medicae]
MLPVPRQLQQFGREFWGLVLVSLALSAVDDKNLCRASQSQPLVIDNFDVPQGAC